MSEGVKKFIVTAEVTQVVTRTYEVVGTESDTIEDIAELVEEGNVSPLNIVDEKEATDVSFKVLKTIDESEAIRLKAEEEEEKNKIEAKEEAAEPSSGRF